MEILNHHRAKRGTGLLAPGAPEVLVITKIINHLANILQTKIHQYSINKVFNMSITYICIFEIRKHLSPGHRQSGDTWQSCSLHPSWPCCSASGLKLRGHDTLSPELKQVLPGKNKDYSLYKLDSEI